MQYRKAGLRYAGGIIVKPVYIINGFLESGKTEFITYTLDQSYFQIKGKTLLILCEEGRK